MNISPKALIIGHDHYNTLNIIRALGKNDIPFHLILIGDEKKSFITKSKYLKSCFSLNSSTQLIQFLLKKYHNLSIKPVVISTSDELALLIDKNYNLLSNFLHISSINMHEGGIQYLMDKCNMVKLANEAGFNTPISLSIDLSDIDSFNISDISYPCILKPQISANGSKEDLRICTSPQQFHSIINSIPSEVGKVIIQQFIPSDKIVLVAGCRTDNQQIYTKGTIIKNKAGHNLNNLGLCSLGQLHPTTVEQTNIENFLTKIDYRGLFSFEFIFFEGKYYFIEVNLRSDGLLYFYSAAGINFPAIWVDSHYNSKLFNLPDTKKNIIGMHEFQYLKNYLSLKHILTNITDFLSVKAFSIFSYSDPIPFLYKIKNHSHD